jgi:hypothetical protein
MAAPLRFAALESSVATSFWTELAQAKLERLRLSEAPVELCGVLCFAVCAPAL